MAKVSVILVNYYSSSLLAKAISTFKNSNIGLDYEIIIVDNSKDKEEKKKLEQLFNDGEVLVFSKENLGFGNANNLGFKKASGEYLYFLNPDTISLNNSCIELANYLDNNKDCGVVGSNLYSKEMQPIFSYYYLEKNLENERKNASIFNLLKKKKNNFNYISKPIEIFGFVSGASLMIRKELFDKIGGFSKDIFMYAEESLLCANVRKLGYKIFNVPSSKVVHLEGKTIPVNKERAKMAVDGNYVYYKELYGNKEAYKYLKLFERVYKRNYVLSSILFKKQKANNFKELYLAYKTKRMELDNEK